MTYAKLMDSIEVKRYIRNSGDSKHGLKAFSNELLQLFLRPDHFLYKVGLPGNMEEGGLGAYWERYHQLPRAELQMFVYYFNSLCEKHDIDPLFRVWGFSNPPDIAKNLAAVALGSRTSAKKTAAARANACKPRSRKFWTIGNGDSIAVSESKEGEAKALELGYARITLADMNSSQRKCLQDYDQNNLTTCVPQYLG